MNIHKDVLKVIRDDYYTKMENGMALNQGEMMDLMRINDELASQDFESVDKTNKNLKEFEIRYNELLDRHQLTFKIFIGFLQLHDLEYEFDNYYDRITRKLTPS